MGKKGSFDYAYNAQISVDADLQIIVAQHISQNANDKQELEPALKALQDTAGQLPDHLSADNGYFSGDNLQVNGLPRCRWPRGHRRLGRTSARCGSGFDLRFRLSASNERPNTDG